MTVEYTGYMLPMHHTLTLVATAFRRDQLIHPEKPQIALAGRSNVGKSSLINALAHRKQLAKTSSTPGKTRSINYFQVDDSDTFLVDLPGYGYARCSQTERNAWAALLEHYLSTTSGLLALALLIDARHLPQKLDTNLAAYAASLNLPLIPILTKKDKCSAKIVQATITAWQKLLPNHTIITTSAAKNTGINEVWDALARVFAGPVSLPN